MKRVAFLSAIILISSILIKCYSQAAKPDTVKVGIYITSIHDIDFKQKEYTADLWLWLKYKNKAFDFLQNLEVPQAKTVNRSFVTVDSSKPEIYVQMKLQCVMKDSWKIGNFPFDRQNLRFSVENSQFDSHQLVFVADTAGKHFDPRFTINGWTIDSCVLTTGTKIYETGFGDETLSKPRSEFSSFRTRMVIVRDASGLFWKMFLGMYIAFLIAYICFFIHTDSIDSRFALTVGSLFAVIGNKYIIDSALPESTSFTLVDTLHGLTLFFIFITVAETAYSLKLVKENKEKNARRIDLVTSVVIVVSYVLANLWFISNAAR